MTLFAENQSSTEIQNPSVQKSLKNTNSEEQSDIQAEAKAVDPKLSSPEKLKKKKKRKRKKKKISRKKLEAYIRKGLKDGTLTLDRLNYIETKYWTNEFRYSPHVNYHPYMPHKWDYGLELGSMEIEKPLYWLGGNLGYNIGTCVLTNSQTCQQYMDVLLGSSGRDGETNWYGVLSLRWQFVNFPNTFSPIGRVFAGVMNRIANDESKQFFIYGIGAGFTTYLHPRADLRLELRHGWGKDIGNFSQAFLSVELKVSRWLDFFAGKLESVGVGTGKVFKSGLKGAGHVIKGTGKVIKKGVDESREVFKKDASD